MRKILMIALAAMMMAGCGKQVIEDAIDDDPESGVVDEVKTKKFTFTVKGDFASMRVNNEYSSEPAMAPRRAPGYLQADGQDMTDLWVYDYMGDECVQSLHQSPSDDAWGQPQMQLTYGSHHIYFVASRGTDASVNTSASQIVWEKPSDTFWKDYEVDVVSTSNGNRAVTLDRVATKFRITITDEVPANVATMTVTPATWYYGMNYRTGEPCEAKTGAERVVNVPATYVGTTGNLSMSIFGLSSATEWTTDVAVEAKNSNGDVIGQASLVAVPIKRNRVTDYSGPLFGAAGNMSISLNATWDDPVTGTW